MNGRGAVTIITGASSGIGAALALRLAQRSGAVLGLLGRDTARLRDVAHACEGLGARVATAAIDVRDAEALRDWLSGFDDRHWIDCVIANAGVSGGTLGAHPRESEDQAHAVFAINVTGALNTVMPLLPRLKARGRGRIVLMSSLAAFAPLADHPAYSASKAALLAIGLAWRAQMARDNLIVQIVCPGFVATPMSAALTHWKPWEISAGDAAVRIERGIAGNRAIIAFPWPLAFLARRKHLAPEWAARLAMGAFRS